MVEIDPYGTITTDLCSYFATCNGVRVECPAGYGKLPISGSDIVNLYFEIVVNDAYYYVVPHKEYLAAIWLVPVKVAGGGQ